MNAEELQKAMYYRAADFAQTQHSYAKSRAFVLSTTQVISINGPFRCLFCEHMVVGPRGGEFSFTYYAFDGNVVGFVISLNYNGSVK